MRLQRMDCGLGDQHEKRNKRREKVLRSHPVSSSSGPVRSVQPRLLAIRMLRRTLARLVSNSIAHWHRLHVATEASARAVADMLR